MLSEVSNNCETTEANYQRTEVLSHEQMMASMVDIDYLHLGLVEPKKLEPSVGAGVTAIWAVGTAVGTILSDGAVGSADGGMDCFPGGTVGDGVSKAFWVTSNVHVSNFFGDLSQSGCHSWIKLCLALALACPDPRNFRCRAVRIIMMCYIQLSRTSSSKLQAIHQFQFLILGISAPISSFLKIGQPAGLFYTKKRRAPASRTQILMKTTKIILIKHLIVRVENILSQLEIQHHRTLHQRDDVVRWIVQWTFWIDSENKILKWNLFIIFV